MIRHFIIPFFLLLVMGSAAFAQDPQTNEANIFYPLLDDYIKEGYNRNLRTHTRNLRTIDYVYVLDIKTYLGQKHPGYREYGSTATYKVYRYWNANYNEYRYAIAFNIAWRDNKIMMRRMFYKTMGLTSDLKECHEECDHIMSKRPLFDPHLFFYDQIEGNWEKELDTLFDSIKNKG